MKTYNHVIFLLFALSTSGAFAQTLDYEWIRQVGGSYVGQYNGLITDNDGNLIVTGTFLNSSRTLGTIMQTKPYSIPSALFVAKNNSYGNIPWEKMANTISYSEETYGYSGATDGNNNIFGCGDLWIDSVALNNNAIVLPSPLSGNQRMSSIFNNLDDSTAFEKNLIFGFGVLAHTGMFMGEIPMRPLNSGFGINAGDNWVGSGYGVSIDYRFHKNFALHFDATHYTLKTPIAYSGFASNLTSSFKAYNNNYDPNLRVGPFEENYNYHRNTTAMRFGLKGYFLKKKSFDVWYGGYYSVFAWSINMLNEERNKTLGNASGTTSFAGLFNIGVDLWDKNRSFGGTIFFESGGAPLTGPFTIEDCIITGWDYYDGGSHVMGTYRFGVYLNFSQKRKQG